VSTAATRRVAAFDLDGTLTTHDSVVPFLRLVAGTTRLSWSMVRHPVELTRGLVGRDRDLLKAVATRAAFSGRRVDDVDRLGARHADRIRSDWLRDDTVQALRAHRAAGDCVVLVSASYEAYLRPLGASLGVDAVLGTRLEADDGVLTGRLDGPNCRAAEKVRRLHDWFAGHGGGRSAVDLVAYGDSAGDRELLADADVAHWVGRYRP
jgi:phosphatidylglycerophosphatase C